MIVLIIASCAKTLKIQNYSGNHIAHVHQDKVHGIFESEGSLKNLLLHMNNTNVPLRETEHIAKSMTGEQAHLQQEVCAKRISRTSVWCIDGGPPWTRTDPPQNRIAKLSTFFGTTKLISKNPYF